MTRCCIKRVCAATALCALAAAPLCAADQPANVPTYQGQRPADKPLPKNVPVYNPESSMPRLVRRSMNAPRPGVAVPTSVSIGKKAPKDKQKDEQPDAGEQATPNAR